MIRSNFPQKTLFMAAIKIKTGWERNFIMKKMSENRLGSVYKSELN